MRRPYKRGQQLTNWRALTATGKAGQHFTVPYTSLALLLPVCIYEYRCGRQLEYVVQSLVIVQWSVSLAECLMEVECPRGLTYSLTRPGMLCLTGAHCACLDVTSADRKEGSLFFQQIKPRRPSDPCATRLVWSSALSVESTGTAHW